MSATTATPSSQRLALLPLFIVNLFLVRPAIGTARRTTFYEDTSCHTEVFQEFVYSAHAIDSDDVVSEAPFNVCYPRGSTGAITVCNVSDGSTSVETYLDTECTRHLYTTSSSSACVSLFENGERTPPGGPGSSMLVCAETSSSETVKPDKFNLIGSPYSDNQCAERTGGDHVVPGTAFGVGGGTCDNSLLSRAQLNALSQCSPDGSVFSQMFLVDDGNCTGDMMLEAVTFSAIGDGGGVCTRGVFDDREEYYRLTSCTTDEVTDKTPIPPTPSPTVGPETSSDRSQSYNFDDDGDDEDTSAYGEHSSDRESKDSSDDSSDDSDDNGVNASGSRGKDRSNDLSYNEIYAIAFGVSTAVLIFLFSAIFAYAGREQEAKVGPKA